MNDEGKSVFLPGMTIGHRYEILRLLRNEAHGEVMLARDQVLDLDVGLKLLSNDHPEFSRLLEYYRREALWGLRLHHPQILGVHHLDETAEGVFLILEPFIGNSLWELLGHAEALTINDSLYFIEVLAQGVAYGHKHGVNHQNFNPQQVLVSATDGIKIINFAFPAEPSEIHAYPEMQAYISPEIWQGRLPTAASNLFSLGVIGYRMLTGTFPFPLQPEGAIPYQISRELAAFDKIPEALQPLFSRCLKPEPEKRFQSAADFLSRLSALREKLTPGYAIKNKSLEGETAAPPVAANQKTQKPPSPTTAAVMEPEVEIDSDWQESNGFQRQSFKDKILQWYAAKQQQATDFLGAEPLRRNRHKQLAAGLGGGLAFLLMIFGLNSLFSSQPKLKIPSQPLPVVEESAGPALQAPLAAKPPALTASPASTPEVNPEPAGEKPTGDGSKTAPEKAVPVAVPAAPTKKPAAPAPTKVEKPAVKPEKSPPKPATEVKTSKPDTSPKVVATLDKEMPARKQADALIKQGQRAIVKKVKQGNKTVYQVLVLAGANSPAKPPVAAPKPKGTAKPGAN